MIHDEKIKTFLWRTFPSKAKDAPRQGGRGHDQITKMHKLINHIIFSIIFKYFYIDPDSILKIYYFFSNNRILLSINTTLSFQKLEMVLSVYGTTRTIFDFSIEGLKQ